MNGALCVCLISVKEFVGESRCFSPVRVTMNNGRVSSGQVFFFGLISFLCTFFLIVGGLDQILFLPWGDIPLQLACSILMLYFNFLKIETNYLCVPHYRNGGLDRGHCTWTDVLWPWQISSSVPVICGHQALNLYAWTINMYICWWAGQRMLDTWVCAGKCCNAVFFPGVIGNLGDVKGHKHFQAFVLLFSSRWAMLYRIGWLPFWKWTQPFIAHYPFSHPFDRYVESMCMWERETLCVCFNVSMCVSEILHLS